MKDIYGLRKDYTQRTLAECNLASHPIDQFAVWLQDACNMLSIEEPQAMSVATVDNEGQPFSRIVLLREFSRKEGFIFFTNYDSDKGKQLAHNNRVSLLFHWIPLERQVHIQGVAFRTAAESSDAYFASRPFGNQLSAYASVQSSSISSRTVLEDAYKRFHKQYSKEGICPRPSYWGGIYVIPNKIEFWQGRPSRLHDRLQYIKKNKDRDEWAIRRRSP